MKTIEDGAKEYAKLRASSDVWRDEISKDFKAGVEFAQRWIPVDEELPDVKDNPYQVLVMSGTGHMETYHIIDSKSQHFIKKYISWRPIERI